MIKLKNPMNTAITAIPISNFKHLVLFRMFYLSPRNSGIMQKSKCGDGMVVRILRWIVSRLLFTLFPIVFSITLIALIDNHASWVEVVSHGELFMVTVSIIAPVIGNLLQQRRKRRPKSRGGKVADIIITGGLLFQLMAAVGYFAGVKIAEHLGRGLDGTRIMTISVYLMVGGSLSVISCILRGNKV
ncbi:MAG TPA: hypothetical protein VHR47_12080 [Bacillota bacterium]|nr:hypothetical protein [Bacillota bacterium]